MRRRFGTEFMKLLRIALKRETAVPVLTLVFASGVSVALVFARIAWTGKLRYAFLIWNLFLAWMPLFFALLAEDKYRATSGRDWRFLTLMGAWLLFFPNAPYIFTDVIHLQSSFFAHFWVDLMLILLCAFTGLVLGFISLYIMQSIVTRILGRWFGWCFIAVVAGLSGFGIYLGRFLRFNSWDILWRPIKLFQGIGGIISDPFVSSKSIALPILFATFIFIAYVTLYALTHLEKWEEALQRAEPG
jgi:uncharacterized membrane protein